jgi:type I restriction enzyme M protein
MSAEANRIVQQLWRTLVDKDGLELQSQYRRLLEHLGKQHGLLGLVFCKAQNKIQNPAKLKRPWRILSL